MQNRQLRVKCSQQMQKHFEYTLRFIYEIVAD